MKTFTAPLKSDKKLETCYEAGDLPREETKLMLALTLVPSIGAASFRRLMDAFGSAEAVYAASQADLLIAYPQIKREGLENILAGPNFRAVTHQEEICVRLGVKIISWRSPLYPKPLLTLNNPVPFVFMWGKWKETDNQAVALVGTRHPSTYGKKMATELALGLVESGVTVVSGLARGIDTCAHHAALSGGGRTIAVLGSGLDWIYPSENIPLAEKIAQQGCLISEFPMGTAPHATHFPRRNRFISALSLGTVVVEAGSESGALITSEFALEQGREVFAVPGVVQNPGSRGPHQLIREGAHLVERAEDIIAVLEGLNQAVPARRSHFTKEPVLNISDLKKRNVDQNCASHTNSNQVNVTQKLPVSQKVPVTQEIQVALKLPLGYKLGLESSGAGSDLLAILGSEGLSLELILEKAKSKSALKDTPIHRLLTGLLELELRGKVRRLPGGLFKRA